MAASLRHRTYGASRLRLWWLSVPMRVVSSCRPREVVLAMLPFALVEGPLRARCMMDNLSPGCGRCNLTAVLVGTSLARSRPRVGICRILRSPPAARSPRSFHESRLIRKADVAASLRHRTYGASRLRLWWLSVPMRVVSSCRPREVVLAMLPFALVEGPLRARCMMDNLSPGCGRCNLTAVLVGTSLARSRPRVGICRILRSPPAARSPRSSRAACYAASAACAWRNGS